MERLRCSPAFPPVGTATSNTAAPPTRPGGVFARYARCQPASARHQTRDDASTCAGPRFRAVPLSTASRWSPVSSRPGSGSGVDQVSTARRPTIGSLHHLDDVPVAERLRSSDVTGPQVEQPQPGEAHSLTPDLGIVALLGPSVVLVGRFVVCDEGDQIGLGQGAVIVDSALPGCEGFDVTTGRADSLQLSRATFRPVRQEEDPLRIRCPSRRGDLRGAPGELPRGLAPIGRCDPQCADRQLVRLPDRRDNERDPSAVRRQHRGGRRTAIDHELVT